MELASVGFGEIILTPPGGSTGFTETLDVGVDLVDDWDLEDPVVPVVCEDVFEALVVGEFDVEEVCVVPKIRSVFSGGIEYFGRVLEMKGKEE